MTVSPGAPESPRLSTVRASRAARRDERQQAASRRRRRKRSAVVLLGVLALLSPALYSYTATMLLPSSLPLGVRSVEWLRDHHGNWLVDGVENFYYTWNAPKKGGPQLKASLRSGIGAARSPRAKPCRWPPRIKPVFPPAAR